MAARLFALVLLAAVGTALVPSSSAGQAGDFPPGAFDGPSACSVVALPAVGAKRPARTAAEVWIQCNYLVTSISLRSSKPIFAVGREPSLQGAEPDDRLSCRRSGRNGASCSGSLGAFVRVRLPLRLRAQTCRPRPLRVRVTASGGLDCEGGPCPAIGLLTTTRSTPPPSC